MTAPGLAPLPAPTLPPGPEVQHPRYRNYQAPDGSTGADPAHPPYALVMRASRIEVVKHESILRGKARAQDGRCGWLDYQGGQKSPSEQSPGADDSCPKNRTQKFNYTKKDTTFKYLYVTTRTFSK